MPTISIPVDYARFTFEYRLFGNSTKSYWSVGIHLGHDLSYSDFTAAETFLSGTNLGANLAGGSSLVGMVVENDVHRFESIFSSAGTAGINAPPNNVSMLMHLTTGLKGHKYHGLIYFPGAYLDESNIAPDGTIDAGEYAAQQAFFAGFLADLVDSVGADGGVVFHTDGSTPTPVLNLALDARTASQRRRLRPR
jgi:hypothetical protein